MNDDKSPDPLETDVLLDALIEKTKEAKREWRQILYDKEITKRSPVGTNITYGTELKRKRIGEPPFSYEEVHMLNITKFLLSGEFALVVRSHEQVFLYYDAATAVEKAL